MREITHIDPSPTIMNEPMLPLDYRTIWSTNAIEFEDIPTVQDVLRACDDHLLLDEIMCTERARFRAEHGSAPSKKQDKHARKRLRKALAKMRGLKVKASRKWCIFPELSFDACPSDGAECSFSANSTIACSIEPCLIRRADFHRAGDELEANRPYLGRDDYLADASRRAADHKHGKALETYGIEFTPQKKTLGYRIWMAGTLSERERYQFLAAIFDDMTFFGYEPKAQKKRLAHEAKELKKDLAKASNEHIAYSSEIMRAGHANGIPGMASAADFGLAAADAKNTRAQALNAFRIIRKESKKNFPKGMSLEEVNAEINAARMAGAHRRAMDATVAALNHNAHLELLQRVNALERMLQRGYRGHRSLGMSRGANGLDTLLSMLYTKEKLTFDDLPTLHDLLAAAEQERLVERIYNDARGERFSSERVHAILDEMLALECERHDSWMLLLACKDSTANDVVPACVEFSQAPDAQLAARDAELAGGDWGIYKQLRSRDGRRSSVILAEESNRHSKGKAKLNGDFRKEDFSLDPTDDLGGLEAFGLRCLGLNPWASELSCKVWIDKRFDNADRYSFLANAFFALTEYWESDAERIACVKEQQAKVEKNGPVIGEPLDEDAWERIICPYGAEDAAAAQELVRLLDHMGESFR